MGKVLITGVSGFIGSNFLHYIKHHAPEILAELILISSKEISGFKCLSREHPNLEGEINRLTEDKPLDIVFHLGSYTPKIGSEGDNVVGSNSNIFFTAKLLSMIRPPKVFVFTSTLDVYQFTGVVSEITNPAPTSLYGWSKLYCEKMLATWAQKNQVKLQILRVGHVYGEGEEAYRKLIPVTIESCLASKNPDLYTTGEEVRSFIYIADLCRMLYKASRLEMNTGPVNLVGNEPLKVREVMQSIINLINPSLKINFLGNLEGTSTIFDNSKTVALFGDEFTPFKIGIEREIIYTQNVRSQT
jgi:UDP-glucose 4-epimerase